MAGSEPAVLDHFFWNGLHREHHQDRYNIRDEINRRERIVAVLVRNIRKRTGSE